MLRALKKKIEYRIPGYLFKTWKGLVPCASRPFYLYLYIEIYALSRLAADNPRGRNVNKMLIVTPFYNSPIRRFSSMSYQRIKVPFGATTKIPPFLNEEKYSNQ
jgi:hypothetical protein